jgi:nicotinamidase-related amidase
MVYYSHVRCEEASTIKTSGGRAIMDKNGGLGLNLVTREECVLVIIDVQERLMPVIAKKEIVIQNILRILKFAQLVDIPIVITEQEKLGPTLAKIASEALGIHPLGKVYFNCYMSAEFDHRIKQLEKKTLILAGVEAHICVAQTALYALPLFKVHIVADAVGSRSLENRNIAIERMRQSGAIITTTEMFIYEILQRAGTDKFKDALQLVK